MKLIEAILGIMATVAALAAGGFAVFVLGVLLMKGPAKHDWNHTASNLAGSVTTVPTEKTDGAPPAIEPAASGNQVESGSEQIAKAPPVLDSPDPAQGKKLYKKCKACHTISKDGADKVGPNLWSLVGRKIASRDGFKYSDALTALSVKSWEPAFLDAYLSAPKTAIPGNKMVFAGIKKPAERQNLIAYLAAQSDTPTAPQNLQFVKGDAAGEGDGDTAPDKMSGNGEGNADDTAAIEPPKDPVAPSEEELAEISKRVAALEKEAATLDHQRASYHPIHFDPEIRQASDGECLVCHQGILKEQTLPQSPAGLSAIDALAWYQTLDTYQGGQAMFHWRHMESPFAKAVMNLSCNFCHKGNDPREETPDMEPGKPAFSASSEPGFTLRKMINPSVTCLRCHGTLPDPVNIMGLGGPWHEVRADMEDDETPNGCLTCHDELFRTVRHRVTYLKAASIEEAAKTSSDVCFGCHGGRAWYRISYPYPRHPWPDMDPETPDWATGRPTESEPEYQLEPQAAQ